MNVEQIEPGFSNLISIGRYAVFVYISKNGVLELMDDVFEKIKTFNYIVIKSSDDPLYQKDELSKLLKKLVKNNPNVKIEIYTKGVERPLEYNQYKDHITFNITIDINTLGEDHNINFENKKLVFYSEIGSNFIFEIDSIDDIDSIVTIVNVIGIKKQQVFIMPKRDIEDIDRYAKYYNFNLALKVVW